jgi:acyl-CoA reductase-like NAD-dependent aldehyde dehydrogenase
VASAPTILGSRHIDVGDARAWVAYEPLGLLLAVMPWNFPVWQVMRFAVPAVTAGNGIVLNHSPNVTGSALAMQNVRYRHGARSPGCQAGDLDHSTAPRRLECERCLAGWQ